MKSKILFVACLLMGLMMINSGLNKFFQYLPMPTDMPEKMMKTFDAFMQIGWLFPLVAVAEIIGGILFIIPKFRTLGALILFPILIGILLFHIIAAPSGIIITIVLFAIELVVLYENREKLLPIIR